MLKRLLIAGFFAGGAFAQSNVANFISDPTFRPLDNNGQPVAGGKVCFYNAGTQNLATVYVDAAGDVQASNPVILNGAGEAQLYGSGNYKIVFQQPGDNYCPGTGAIIWSMDNVFILSQTPTFTTVNATIFNSTATSSTPAIQQFTGNFMITGAGNADFQSTTVTNDFISNATGTSPAVTQASGNFTITGAGDGTFNSTAGNWVSLIGNAADATAPGAGFAFLDYNTTTGALDYNLGGAGWVQLSVPGANTQVIYNNSGGFGASSHFTFASDTLTLGGGTSTGVVAPLFTSSNTGTNNAFTVTGGGAYIQGNGNAGFGVVTVTNALGIGTNSNTDASGTLTLSGGTASQGWPSGHTYSTAPRCFTNDLTGLHVSTAGATTTTLTILGNGSDQVYYWCVFAQY